MIRNGDILSKTPAEFSTAAGEELSSTKLLLDGLDGETADSLHRIQVAQTVRAIPLLLLFHAVAAFSLQSLARFEVLDVFLIIWHFMATLVGVGLAPVS